MAERKEYKLTEKQYQKLANAATQHASTFADAKENVSDLAWEYLGAELGFDWRQVQSVKGQTDRYFTGAVLDDKQWDAARKKHGIVVDPIDALGLAKCIMVGDVKCFEELPVEGKPLPKHHESPFLMVLEFADTTEIRKAMKLGFVKFGGDGSR